MSIKTKLLMKFEKSFRFILLLSLFFSTFSIAQEDSIEVYLIDSYVTPELPHTFVLSFFTSDYAKSFVVINNNEFVISDTLTDTHKSRIDITHLKLTGKSVPFIIYTTNADGKKFKSEKYEFLLPTNYVIEGGSNLLTLGLFVVTNFAVPAVSYVNVHGTDYFAVNKEIPILSFRSESFKYPFGYFAFEYSHIFNADRSNYLRLGYKQIIEVPAIEYVSPGINVFTNFDGYNGISPEISIGWLKLLDTFTIYSRYRFNYQPNRPGNEFNEISIGLYSSFFSFYL